VKDRKWHIPGSSVARYRSFTEKNWRASSNDALGSILLKNSLEF
jgi:hypothetical protein